LSFTSPQSQTQPAALSGKNESSAQVELLLTLDEAAALLRCDPKTLENKVRAEEIPWFKIGNRWLWDGLNHPLGYESTGRATAIWTRERIGELENVNETSRKCVRIVG
jgi:hypothetical protein